MVFFHTVAVVVIFMLALPVQVEARFALQSDAASEIQFCNRTIEVYEDGTSDDVVELKIKILNDTGRSNLATHPLYYDEATQKIEIVSAKTFDQGVEYLVNKDAIEDKPIASQEQGFTSYRQVMLSFPHLRVGSEVYLKYIMKQHTPDLHGTYAVDFVYGIGGYWISDKIKVTSAIPLLFATNDPEGFLDIQSKKEGKRQILEITLKRPIIKQAIDEVDILLNDNVYPWVSVSSVNDWKFLIQKVTPEYERILSKPLPKLLQGIVDQAARESDVLEKINRVTSLLAHDLHYMGDWRSISGRFYPNSLEKIALSHRGDCKDFATVTVAMLRKLGIRANVAWVRRGGAYDNPNEVPALTVFNHAIVRVESQGRVLWIDPTNFVSFAHGLFPDIADRWVLPLMISAEGRERIPGIAPESNKFDFAEEIHFFDKKRVIVRGKVFLKGPVAIDVTGMNLKMSQENVDYAIISQIADVNRMVHWKVKPCDLSSRIVQDFAFEYEYESRNLELKTNGGAAYLLATSSVVAKYLTRIQDRVSDLLVLGQPMTRHGTTLLKGVKLCGKLSLDCTMDNSWFSASRRVLQKKEGIEVSDVLVVKRFLIPNATLHTKEFLRFQEKLERCFDKVALVFKR